MARRARRAANSTRRRGSRDHFGILREVGRGARGRDGWPLRAVCGVVGTGPWAQRRPLVFWGRGGGESVRFELWGAGRLLEACQEAFLELSSCVHLPPRAHRRGTGAEVGPFPPVLPTSPRAAARAGRARAERPWPRHAGANAIEGLGGRGAGEARPRVPARTHGSRTAAEQNERRAQSERRSDRGVRLPRRELALP